MTSTLNPLPETPKSSSACLAQTMEVGPPVFIYGPDISLRMPILIVGACARARTSGSAAAAAAVPIRVRRETVIADDPSVSGKVRLTPQDIRAAYPCWLPIDGSG